MLLQLDDLRLASSRLVEQGNPTHANPSTQITTAWRDDRPTARRRAIGCEYGFLDRIRTPHNPYIAMRTVARNRRPARPKDATADRRGDKKGQRAQRTDKRPNPYSYRQT